MLDIQKDADLKNFNTFGVSARAKYLAEIHSLDDFIVLSKSPEFIENKKIILGGGSNVLFTKDFDGLVMINEISGMEIIDESGHSVLLRAGGGEKWHDLVLFACQRGLWGLENLALIPGTVGASPVQNIGAYGVELQDVLESVEFIKLDTGENKILKREECNFGYRDSIFKRELKDNFFIHHVNFLLKKKGTMNLAYKGLEQYALEHELPTETPIQICELVSAVRKTKLPDPKDLGSAGSFFKNVIVAEEKAEEIKKNYPDMPNFKEPNGIKIPTGWLIEQAGWKGKREGGVGVYQHQALVLVNYGEGTGEELWSLAQKIISSVYDKFGIQIEPEVNII